MLIRARLLASCYIKPWICSWCHGQATGKGGAGGGGVGGVMKEGGALGKTLPMNDHMHRMVMVFCDVH